MSFEVNKSDRESDIIDRVVHTSRVSKTVKGGRRLSIAVLVVVGDRKGRIGFGHGKAKEGPEAIQKAKEAAKKNMVRIPLKEGRTLHHDIDAKWGAGKVVMRTAVPGTGIIAGGAIRSIFECLGVSDVVVKSLGTSNPYNVVRATFKALQEQTSPRYVASRRNKKPEEIVARRESELNAQ